MKDVLYRIENNFRIYKEDVSIENIFYSELNIHFLDYLNNDTKIFYLQFESNHNFSLDKSEINYLYSWGERYKENLYYVFSENIKIIKYSQKMDLFFLTSVKNIDFLLLIPKLDINNRYYFNLIIGVDFNFDINQFHKWNLKTSKLQTVNEINLFNLNENYLNQIIDVYNNKFKNCCINRKEFLLYKEKKIKDNYSQFSKLSPVGKIIYKKIIFKLICFHIYWYNDKILKFDNLSFYMDSKYKDTFAIKDENNNLKIITQPYFSSCFFDVISDSPEYICFIGWEMYDNF